MRILHTADWHLGDTLLGYRRSDDIHRNVERIANLCEERQIDVLVIAGDIFTEACTGAAFRQELEFLNATFAPHLNRGGSIVAVAGNHDADPYSEILRQAMRMAGTPRLGELGNTGRWYFATQPTFVLLPDPEGGEIQFVLMPYPFAHRYPRDTDKPLGRDQDHRHRRNAYTAALREIQSHPRFRQDLPTIMVAHVYVNGIQIGGLFRPREGQEILFDEGELPGGWAYLALGHIHAAQAISGMPNARYSGSIERLDFGERDEVKSVVCLEVDRSGLIDEPEIVSLPSTPLLDLVVTDPRETVESLSARCPEAATAIVRCEINVPPGTDTVPLTGAVRKAFPRSVLSFARPEGLPELPREWVSEARTERKMIEEYLVELITDEQERTELISLVEELFQGDAS